jgi:uncharacterized protein (DUF2235 family)
VIHILRSLDSDKKTVLPYYDQGVGTFGIKETLFEWQKLPSRVFGLAFGWGLDRIVSGAYEFLATNYQDEDEIYVFGFSRGAYAARCLAALIRAVGLVPAYQVNLFEYAWSMLLSRDRKLDQPDFKLQGRFKSTFGRTVNIRFLGLFDTVSSVGWIYDPIIIPFSKTNNIVEFVRHAVSIDERRCFFRQNLWSSEASRATNLIEAWFAGVHSDIGGGYPPNDSRLARVALRWMMGEAHSCGLRFDANRAMKELGPLSDILVDRTAPRHDSMSPVWACAEWIPRFVWSGEDSKRHFRIGAMPPFGHPRPRFIPDNAQIHQSVQERLQTDQGYRLPNDPQGITFIDDKSF